ncbi:MAG: N(4)-(beta-N-acetylglucosaminyl)-L-asparaginase [Phycisphaerales bacterium]|nr:N(4)-(beta-N-acetylglucosaminyl)-L-asparaginase [Phycisphaerales bacterium]
MSQIPTRNTLANSSTSPIVVSTWNHGLPANAKALEILNAGGGALDAAEAGVMVTERDSLEHSVGLSGYPDRDGIVTLDAAIMDHTGRAGSVAFVRGVTHPISLARMVMQRTPHVMLVGEGAEQFAREQGVKFAPETPLHPDMLAAWQKWLQEKKYAPQVNRENASTKSASAGSTAMIQGSHVNQRGAASNTPVGGEHNHDTIGMLTLDARGRLAASCTTSGMSYKMHGRVGDSPIIGAGLFVDGEVGAAVCTGVGEIVMRTVASFLVVEQMRGGATAQQACEHAIARMIKITDDPKQVQVGVLALSCAGAVGAFAIQGGFTYALGNSAGNQMHEATHAI